MKNIQKIIENIVTKEPTPDAKCAPKIILHWSTKTEGQIYHDLSTGKRLTRNDRDAKMKWENLSSQYIQCSANATPRLTYIKYHRKQQVMELAYIKIPLNRAKPGEIRQLEYNKNWSGNTERYFVDVSQYPRRLFWSDGMLAPMVEVKNILRDTDMHRKAQIYNELFPDDKIEYINFSWAKIDYVARYLTYQRQLTIENSKTAKAALIAKGNALLAKAPTVFPDHIMDVGIVRNFPGISIVEAKSFWDPMMRFYYDGKNFAAAKAPNYDVSYAYSNLRDVSIYNPEDLKDGMFKKYAGLFAKPVLMKNSWNDAYRCENPEKATKFTALKALAKMVKSPMYEQLVKSYTYRGIQLINAIGAYSQTEIFGSNLNQKATTVDKWLGLNKYQLRQLMDAPEGINNSYAFSTRIATFRKVVGPNAASLDNHTSDLYIENLEDLHLLTVNNYYTSPELEPWVEQMIPKVIKQPHVKHNLDVLLDTIRSWKALNWPRPELPQISVSELQRLHDLYTNLMNEQWRRREALYAEEARKQEERIQKENKPKLTFRDQLNYDDENYLIRLPKDEDEICNEGMTLHHCVGNYAHDHSIGSTTIMFLRKKSEPDKPFYTIEVDIGVVDGKVAGLRIRQIHGFGNRWLGNDPEAIPTVVRWLRTNNVQCNEAILTSTSTQYYVGSKFIKMPEVA